MSNRPKKKDKLCDICLEDGINVMHSADRYCPLFKLMICEPCCAWGRLYANKEQCKAHHCLYAKEL